MSQKRNSNKARWNISMVGFLGQRAIWRRNWCKTKGAKWRVVCRRERVEDGGGGGVKYCRGEWLGISMRLELAYYALSGHTIGLSYLACDAKHSKSPCRSSEPYFFWAKPRKRASIPWSKWPEPGFPFVPENEASKKERAVALSGKLAFSPRKLGWVIEEQKQSLPTLWRLVGARKGPKQLFLRGDHLISWQRHWKWNLLQKFWNVTKLFCLRDSRIHRHVSPHSSSAWRYSLHKEQETKKGTYAK